MSRRSHRALVNGDDCEGNVGNEGEKECGYVWISARLSCVLTATEGVSELVVTCCCN